MIKIIKNSRFFLHFVFFIVAVFLLINFFIPSSVSLNNSNTVMNDSYFVSQLTLGTTLYVGGSGPGNYSTIKDAIDNATDGDTIYVYNGTYKENLVLNKIITLIGESRDRVIIDGSNSGNTVKITSDNVSITHFTIQHGGIGIYIVRSSNISIYNNRIIDNWEGIGLLESTTTIISTNIITDNFFEGINPVESSSVTIQGNVIVGNLQGIFISKSENNIIVGNNIKSNTRGIEIRSSSNKNLIYHNNFIKNSEDNGFDECSNSWDNGYPSGGNYWDDYTGKDTDGDGIGDTPYVIAGDSNKDYYPFINQSGWNLPPHQPSNPSPENGSVDVDVNADLYWTGGDPDPGDVVTYDVYFGTTTPPPLVKTNHTKTSFDPGTMNFNSTYYWKIIAWDNHDTSNESSVWHFSTSLSENTPPEIPIQPNGTQFGFVYISYNYSTLSVDPEDDNISYGWDWDGDFSIDIWSVWYTSGETSTISHAWTIPGSYKVRVKARDIHYAESDFSSPITVVIALENQPPDAPIIDGPTTGKRGVEYEYTLNTTDPDTNNVKYYIDWGDGKTTWTDYYPSGTEIIIKHTWNSIGSYTIRTKAQDTFGEESEWNTLKVIIPKTQISWFFILERLQWMFPALKCLFGML